MGKRTKLREAQRRATEQAIAARLRAHSPARLAPAFINSYCDFDPDYRERIEAYRSFAVRAPGAWRCTLRQRSPEQRFLELVRFTFADFPVPHHLENAWISETETEADRLGLNDGADTAGEDKTDFRRWYIAVGQGRSLYKEATHRYLSKLETHHFVNAPPEVDAMRGAFWYAVARAQTNDQEAALRVARSKVATFPITSSFWKEVAHFFAHNPTSVLEMNDLTDFVQIARREDPDFSMKGRSLPALRRRMQEWHRELREIACGGRWSGRRLPDTSYLAGSDHEPLIWHFRQIKTGEELAREGRRLAHCVVTYKDLCVAGHVSIWSVTCEDALGQIDYRLTIELRSDGCIAQCRGFANRLPSDEEAAVVWRWANEFGLIW
jgi:PcfJ-like protein